MAADQQFCLRWNNHQSTLVSVFDSLLEKGALVDCTIAAEGQSMKAHKVVLSACSSYFETLLSEHYEKHPIIILKDVKYQELRALMDYMYRGEVNILQDQLASLLKVAESLQIKGLSDSGGGDEKETAQERPDSKKQSAPRPQPISRTKSDTENRRPSSGYSDPNEFPVASPPATPKASRNECSSPIARKRKKVPENSMNDLDTSSGLDGYDNSSSNELPPQKHPVPKTPVKLPLPKIKPPVPVQPVIEKSVPSIFTPVESPRPKPTPPPPPSVPVEQDVKPKVEPTSEVYIQPKTEFVEEEEEIEDLTLDDEEDYDMSDQAMAGPSHGGDGSNQGFLQWQDQSQDEMFNAAQEAIGGQKDSQGVRHIKGITSGGWTSRPNTNNVISQIGQRKFVCSICKTSYRYKRTLNDHLLLEHSFSLDLNLTSFDCPYCKLQTIDKNDMKKHIMSIHSNMVNLAKH